MIQSRTVMEKEISPLPRNVVPSSLKNLPIFCLFQSFPRSDPFSSLWKRLGVGRAGEKQVGARLGEARWPQSSAGPTCLDLVDLGLCCRCCHPLSHPGPAFLGLHRLCPPSLNWEASCLRGCFQPGSKPCRHKDEQTDLGRFPPHPPPCLEPLGHMGLKS